MPPIISLHHSIVSESLVKMPAPKASSSHKKVRRRSCES